MVDWFYIGYCTVMAMLAIAFAYAAVFGFRALRGLPRSFRLAFAAVAIVTTLAAQKTNNVPPNMSSPLPQMMQGGLFQGGAASCRADMAELEAPPPWGTQYLLGSVLQVGEGAIVTANDIARGWCIEGVTTNENFSYRHDERKLLIRNADKRCACRELARPRRGFVVWEQQD